MVGLPFLELFDADAHAGTGRPDSLVVFLTTQGSKVEDHLVGAGETGFGFGEVRLPAGAVGWTALALSGGLFTIGMFAFFGALSLMAVVRAATVANLEPLWAIFVAMMLFGEAFAGLQWLGAALVIGAVLIGPLFDRARG